MSTVIDQRIVEMQFENKDFEKGVQSTIKSLENLEDKLQFKDGEKGFDRIATAANSMRLNDLESSVDSITNKFTLLGNIGLQALQRISNAVVDAGEKVLKMFTVDPVMAGWGEFETKTNSIQTILAGVRKDYTYEEDAIAAVSVALDELNTYADKTIYSFSDMTSNIGKFTNQGVNLRDSVDSIKGISNWAAAAGANTQQASHAMYNLSQALSGGYVRTIDWKSIENAQMATSEFKDLVIDLAKVMNSDLFTEDGMVKKGKKLVDPKDFHDSLAAGWLTNDVLIEALKIYSNEMDEAKLLALGFTEEQIASWREIGDYANKAATTVRTFTMLMDTLKEAAGSGWARSFDIIFGGFEGTKEFFTTLNEIISPIIERSSELRNALLTLFAEDYSGRDNLLGFIYSFFRLFSSVHTIFNWAIDTVARMMIVPARLADAFGFLESRISAIQEWLETPSEYSGWNSVWDNMFHILNGIFSTIVTIFNVVGEAFGFVVDIASLFTPILDVILLALGDIGSLILDLNYDLSKSNGIHEFFDWLYGIVAPIASSIAVLVANMLQFVRSIVLVAKDKVIDWFGRLWDAIVGLPDVFGNLSGKITGFFDRIRLGFDKVRKLVFSKGAKAIDKFQTVVETFTDSVFGKKKAEKITKWFNESFKPAFEPLFNWFVATWTRIRTFVVNIPNKITELATKFKKGFDAMSKVKYDKTLTPLQNFGNKLSALIFEIFDEDTANTIVGWWNDTIHPVLVTIVNWVNKNIVPVIDTIKDFVSRAWMGLVAAFSDSGETGIEGRILAFFKVFNNDENAKMPEGISNIFGYIQELSKWKDEALTPFLKETIAKIPNAWDDAKKALFGYDEQDERYASRVIHVPGLIDNIVSSFENIRSQIEQKLPRIVDSIKKVIEDASSKLTGVFNSLKNGIFGYDMHSDPYAETNGTVDTVFEYLATVKKTIDEKWPGIWEAIQGFGNTITGEFTTLWREIKAKIFGSDEDYDPNEGGVLVSIFRFFESVYQYVTTEGPVIWGEIKKFYDTYAKPIVDTILEFAKLLFGALSNFFSMEVDPEAGLADRFTQRLGAFDELNAWIDSKVGSVLESFTKDGGLFSQIEEFVSGFINVDSEVDDAGKETKNESILDKIINMIIPSANADELPDPEKEVKKSSGGLFDLLSKGAGGINQVLSSLFGGSFFKLLGTFFVIKNLATIVKGVTGVGKNGVGAHIANILGEIGGIISALGQMFLITGLIAVIGGPEKLTAATDAITTVLGQVFTFITTILTGGGLAGVAAGFIGKEDALVVVAEAIESIGTGIKALMEGLLLLAVNMVVFGLIDTILGWFNIDTAKSLDKIKEMLWALIPAVAGLIGAVRLVTAKMPSEDRVALFQNMEKLALIIDSLVNGLKIFMIAVIAFELFGGLDNLWPEILAVAGIVIVLGIVVGVLVGAFVKLNSTLNAESTRPLTNILSILSTLGPVLLLGLAAVAGIAYILVTAVNNLPEGFSEINSWNLGILMAGIAVLTLCLGPLLNAMANIAVTMKTKEIGWGDIFKGAAIAGLALLAIDTMLNILRKLAVRYTKDISDLLFNLGSDLSSFYSLTKDIKLETFQNAIKCLKELVWGLTTVQFTSMFSPEKINTLMGVARDLGANLFLANLSLSAVDPESFGKPKKIFEKLEEANKVSFDAKSLGEKIVEVRDSGANLVLASDHFGKITDEVIAKVGQVYSFAEQVKNLADLLNTIPAVNLNASTVGAAVEQLAFSISTDNFTITDDGRIAQLDPEKIKAFYRTMADSMPEQDTMDKIAKFGDGNNLTSFSMGLTNLAGAIREYGNVLSVMENPNFAHSESFLTLLDGLGENLPADYSFTDRLNEAAEGGPNSKLGKFSSDIITLGGAIEEYGKALDKTSGVKLLGSALFLAKLASIQKNLNDDGVDSFLEAVASFGKRTITLGDFAGNIKSLGDAVGDFSTHLQTYDNEKFSAAVKNLESIAGLTTTLRGVMLDKDGKPIMHELSVLWGLYHKESADTEGGLEDFGNVIQRIGNGIRLFTEATTDADGNVIDMNKFESQTAFLYKIAALSNELLGVQSNQYPISHLAADLAGVNGGDIKEFIMAFDGISGGALSNATTAADVMVKIANAAVRFSHTSAGTNITAMTTLNGAASIIQDKLIPSLNSLNNTETNNAVYKLVKLHEALSGEVNTALSDSINGVVDTLNTKPITPTIQPVLDLSDPSWANLNGFLQNGLSGMNLENTHVTENVTNFKMDDVLNVRLDSGQLNSLTSAIDGVGNSVGSVSRSISGMYVRMDTGALVGQLVGPLDAALGKRTGKVIGTHNTYYTIN